jgi:hypothetical protein
MMVLPKIVCPKFHDWKETIASLLQCQEIYATPNFTHRRAG